MIEIVDEFHWERVEGLIEDGVFVVIDDAYEDIELFKKTTQREYDHCRNALLVLLDGDRELVEDAYIAALDARIDGEWLYG